MKQRILSGIQPTGSLHLGNYLGAIRNWVKLQDQYECLYCIVDLHAMSVDFDPQHMVRNIRSVAAAYLASGLDPEKCHIFNQSQVIGHTELAWVLNCLTPLGWLNRMTQFKDKAGKHKERASLGLYAYPVLQAADILIYKAHHVPVGEDQKQHVELCRDIAGAFNHRYKQDFFPLPEPQILGSATRVMSLRDGTSKMSKSDPSEQSRIHLTDDVDTIVLKVKKAKTDPQPLGGSLEEYEGRPEALNLVTIYAAMTDASLEDVINQFAGRNFSEFKPALAEVLVEHLAPIAAKYNELLQDTTYIDSILSQGRDYAQKIASKTIEEVYELTGLLRTP